jgi:hypothetical protein
LPEIAAHRRKISITEIRIHLKFTAAVENELGNFAKKYKKCNSSENPFDFYDFASDNKSVFGGGGMMGIYVKLLTP